MSRPYDLAMAGLMTAVLVAGCGGATEPEGVGDPATAPTSTVATTIEAGAESSHAPGAESVVAAYRAWLTGLAARDAEAVCAVHAPDFTIALRQRAILDGRAELGDPCVDFVALLWDDPGVETQPGRIEVTQLTGEDALLAVDFPDSHQTVRMIQRHGGQWFLESTTARTPGGQTATWVAVWCNLSLTDSRDEIVAQMGDPSGEYTVANGGEPQLWWAQGPYDFRVYFELDGTVAEFVGDYDALTAADRAQLDCPELRNRTNAD